MIPQSDNETFNDLVKSVENTEIKYVKASFPIRHEGDGVFSIYNPADVHFTFSADGAGYISERNTAYRYAQFTKLYREESWDELANLANAAMASRKKVTEIILALVDNVCVGVLQKYDNVQHSRLLQAVADAHLDNDVLTYKMNQTHMQFDLISRVASIDPDTYLELALRVINGHSGHQALQYQFLVRSRGYEFTVPLYGRARHLGGVETLVSTLAEAFSRVSSEKLDARLRSMSTVAFISLIRTKLPSPTVRQEQLIHLLETVEEDDGLGLFITLGQYASTKGYSSAVAGILDPVCEHLLTITE